jgi:hypothetical protein
MPELVKATVKAAFTDKTNFRDVYREGDTFEGTEERVRELAIGGYVEKVDGPKAAPRKRKTATTKE